MRVRRLHRTDEQVELDVRISMSYDEWDNIVKAIKEWDSVADIHKNLEAKPVFDLTRQIRDTMR